MQINDTDVFQQIVAPAVLIPACGFLLMSSTARMNTVLARVRAFHAERLDVWLSSPEPGSPAEAVRNLRLEGLEYQSHRLLTRAALLRATMALLLLAIGCNLISALGLVAVFFVGELPSALSVVPSVSFGLGILLMFAATVTSLLEVAKILETVRYEHERVERLCETGPAGGTETVGPDARAGEGTGL